MTIYFIQCSETKFIKIGYAQNPNQRIKELQVGSPHSLMLISVAPGDIAREHKIHSQFDHYRYRGEWFVPAIELLYFIHGNQGKAFDLHFAMPGTKEFWMASRCGTKKIRTSAQLIVAEQNRKNSLYVSVDPYSSIYLDDDHHQHGKLKTFTLKKLDAIAYKYRLSINGFTLKQMRSWGEYRTCEQSCAGWKYLKSLGEMPSVFELKDLMKEMYAVLQTPTPKDQHK